MAGGMATSPVGAVPAPGQRFHPAAVDAARQPSFRLDEGYSEDTRSQSSSLDAVFRAPPGPADVALADTLAALPSWITTLGEADRSELAYTILRTLRTSSMASIVERLHPILHLDPVAFLPPELTFEVFGYLAPSELLLASTISRAWRERAMDSRLWRSLYSREGWTAEHREIRSFESASQLRRPSADARRGAPAKRGPPEPDDDDAAMSHSGLFGGGKKPSTGSSSRPDGPTDDARSPSDPLRSPPDAPEDAEMEDASHATPATASAADATTTTATTPTISSPRAALARGPPSSAAAPLTPSLTLPAVGQRKLNWQYLYGQRRRLEDNWRAGRFTTFRLPHPDFEHEGHAECVYTIQYSGRYLVSGSRDKSLRVWDLDTRRLVRQPLLGHTASVLCLQFDPSEDEDIIVSGSSDTDVIAWRFSTGEKIKRIRHAHMASVLNLRFDKRYLITCSRDETIKVWSRRALEAGDRDFPAGAQGAAQPGPFPAHVVSMAGSYALQAEARLANGGASVSSAMPLPAFSLLMTLHGHKAAVNAIQVHGDQIVSASGDRTIKIWSLQQGACLKTISAHNKGIACVQFDGRRIVSGSSDNTIKIFDRASGAEVACLRGHQYLVRTVQAGFGDQPGSEEDDQAEARAVDRSFFDAAESGRAVGVGKARNAGSKDPGEVTALGASLPPGGGGSRWGRIVSGSYDETVIIWKRDAEGRWVVGHRLQQQDHPRRDARPVPTLVGPAATTAAPAAHAVPLAHAPPPIPHLQAPLPQPSAAQLAESAQSFPGVLAAQQLQLQLQQQVLQATANNQLLQMTINHHAQNAPGQPLTMEQVQAQMVAQHQAQLAVHQQTQAMLANAAAASAAAGGAGPSSAQAQGQGASHQTQPLLVGAPATTAAAAGAVNAAPALPGHIHQNILAPAGHHVQNPPVVPQQHQAAAAAAAAAAGAAAMGVHGGNARVFKLQFDARRVICCSQDPHIMGWDFAAGDDGIAEASRFFSGLG